MKARILFLFIILISPAYSKDIVVPRGNEGMRIISKPGGVNKVAIEIDGSTGHVSKSYGVTSLGTTKQSILTESQFQSQVGIGWVQMKGQSIAASALCTTHSICTLPDARNKFMKNSDGNDTNLASVYGDSTSATNLGVSWSSSTVTSTNASISWSSINTYVNGNHPTWDSANVTTSQGSLIAAMRVVSARGLIAGENNHAVGYGYTINWSGTNADYPGRYHTHNFSLNKNAWNTNYIDHLHALNKNYWNTNNSHLHTTNKSDFNSNKVLVGDTETAPKHLIINTFIKIN